MEKWSKIELLGNARGMDDGYLYIHESHPLAPKFRTVLQNGMTAKSLKTRLNEAAAYGCAGFTGALRPPLSNELVPHGETVPAPKVSSKASLLSHDGLFTEDICMNDSFCVAFSEPAKLSHKSILLPGAMPPASCLNDQDRQIRRPRLNRGGATISHLGASNGQSHQSGHGSMNISSYERDLGRRTGSGNEMYQAGTRSWGSMEPPSKRQHQGRNPFQNGFPPPPPPPPPPSQRPPWQQQQQLQQHRNPNFRYHHLPQQRAPYRNEHQHDGRNVQMHQHSSQGYHPQQQHPNPHRNPHGGQQIPPREQGGGSHRPQTGSQLPPRNQHGFNFREYNPGSRPPAGAPPDQSSRVNTNVMSSLKAQLKSTLKQNRRPNDRR